MAFNPDSYLARKESVTPLTAGSPMGFDPDSYLAKKEPGLMDRTIDLFTGESRTTPEIESLQEIGAAPELNQLSVAAFRASLGLITTGDTESLKKVFKQQYGDQVSFREDAKGNTIFDFPSGPYALNKPGLSGQDMARGVANILAYTPAGRAATLIGAAVKSAATEAAFEGAEVSVGGDFSPKEIVEAGLLGGIFKGAEDLIGAGYRAIKGSPQSDIVEAGAQLNVPIMTTDVLPPSTFAGRTGQRMGEQVPITGTAGARRSQQETRKAAVSDIAEKYGQFSYKAIVDSLITQKEKVKRAAGNALNRAGEKLDAVGIIPTTNTNRVVDEVREELSRPGLIQSSTAAQDIDTLMDALNSAPQSFTTLKENRSTFRDIVDGADKAERTQLTSRAKSLLQKVQRAMSDDMDQFARDNLSVKELRQWRNANKVYASEAKKMTKSRLKNVLDKGDVTPESVNTMLFSAKPSEVKSLYQSLTNEGRENARSAIISKVIDNLSKRQAGITPNTFASEMGKYGLQTGTFFKGEEKEALNGLLKVLNATRRAQDAAVLTETGQQLLGAGTLASAATNLPMTLGTAVTVGGLARIYESPPVRNALLRMNSIPKGSTQFEKALSEAMAALSSAGQASREEVKEQIAEPKLN